MMIFCPNPLLLKNYVNNLAWAHAVRVYLRGKKKLKYLTDNPPASTDMKYEDWMCEDSIVMGWLWHSMVLLNSSLAQRSNPSPNLTESSAFVSSSAGRGGSTRGGFHHGGRSTRGVRGGRTGGRGDRKYDHCGGTNHIANKHENEKHLIKSNKTK
ncbi:hypothetical protein IFM89_003526 [Coptis chinensis]|uniref:Uncharacterized protein n=1 Tax=Coptis chinensis TaxID=261450 RepID=A0A835GX05_9MAGN|nr:hypothetical protein IFM89_003526 [Coptis chinensis]